MHLEKHIGFMQGRLSDVQHGRIQSFPWGVWEAELDSSKLLGLDLMEWTIDQRNFDLNPLIANPTRVLEIISKKNFRVKSVTCDSFMEAPYWQVGYRKSLNDLKKIIYAMQIIGAETIVIPLVDNSSLSNLKSESQCIEFFHSLEYTLQQSSVSVAFEVDTNASRTYSFIEKFPPDWFGINYDIGNSASLGFNPQEEFTLYGNRITNVHVKDRKYHGKTVPLGEGAAEMEQVFQLLNSVSYNGNYILQTARSEIGMHSEDLKRYIKFTKELITKSSEIKDHGGS